MSRSKKTGCKPDCGICHPEKKWKHQMSRLKRLKARDLRKLGGKSDG